MTKFRAHLQYRIERDDFALFVSRDDGVVSVLSPATYTTGKGRLDAPAQPFVDGDDVRPFLQCMLDEAWSRGYRPTGVESNAGELAATKAHLDDMRALVAGTFKVAVL